MSVSANELKWRTQAKEREEMRGGKKERREMRVRGKSGGGKKQRGRERADGIRAACLSHCARWASMSLQPTPSTVSVALPLRMMDEARLVQDTGDSTAADQVIAAREIQSIKPHKL